jgi:hypothetical protein
VLAIAIVARLHKLYHATVQTTAGGAHHQAQGAGGLAFTVAGVDHQQPAGVFLVVFAPPFVFLFHRGFGIRTEIEYLCCALRQEHRGIDGVLSGKEGGLAPALRLITRARESHQDLNFFHDWSSATKSGGMPSFPT